MTARYLIISGEPSGDFYAKLLIDSLLQINAEIEIFAWGGEHTKSTNVQILQDLTRLSEMGLTAIVSRPIKYYHIIQKAKHQLAQYKITHFIGIDYSGLNLTIAGHAKSLGIKTIQFIAPKTWAYASFRNSKIKKVIDDLIVIFPFELSYFSEKGIQTHYFGNPLTEILSPNCKVNEVYEIGIFPGSRKQEILSILPIMLDIVQQINKPAILGAAIEQLPLIESIVKIHPAYQKITVTEHHVEALKASKLCLCTSGTITLEAALLDKRQIIMYKTNMWNYQLAKSLLQIPFIGLPNIISGEKIVPEFIQHDCRADKIIEYINNFGNMKMNYSILLNKLAVENSESIMKQIAKICAKK